MCLIAVVARVFLKISLNLTCENSFFYGWFDSICIKQEPQNVFVLDDFEPIAS